MRIRRVLRAATAKISSPVPPLIKVITVLAATVATSASPGPGPSKSNEQRANEFCVKVFLAGPGPARHRPSFARRSGCNSAEIEDERHNFRSTLVSTARAPSRLFGPLYNQCLQRHRRSPNTLALDSDSPRTRPHGPVSRDVILHSIGTVPYFRRRFPRLRPTCT